ncbi:MAG: phage tail tape measure protein, partial [Oscillospiraceae bacterium]|nr:phage tail tape measure protein [Oscillospiraceae bacterium]
MAGRIQGITVEIGGDTTKLQTALKGVNTEIRNTQSQLKDVDKLLKLDPGNTELLAQKHRLLGDAVKETKEKLETLKTAAEQAEQALKDGTITQDQYDGLQREIVETEQKLKSLEEQAKQSGTALQEIAAKGEKLKTVGDNVTNVGKKFMPVTLGVVGLGTAAVKTAADFDSAMSKVAAVSGATGSDLEALRDKAREMGEKTKFSASEAAEAMNYMAMAGWKTEDMLSGIEGVMNLAAASGEDLATTSDIVTDALTAFGLTAKDSGHFADILAAASSNANTNVSMMGETFKYCAPIAGALGFSAEDTAEAIGLMANAGIKGSQAGTSLRTIMNNLSGEVKICGSSIGEVTVATTNADGSMRDLSDILADCRTAFAGLTESEKAQAAESLVGKNAMSGFLALMNAGEADIEKLSSAIDNCDGSAASMAETMNDNLAGQLQILKSQLEELAISFGELLMPAIRTIVGWIQKFVDWLNSMDEGTRKVIVTIALVAAAIGPILIIVGKVISAVGTIMTLVPKLAGVINAAKGVFAAFNAVCAANPYVLIIAAIVALVAAFIYLWN